MSHGFGDEAANCGMAAIREPRARPSNVWWKEMARRRTRKEVEVATLRAMPMKMLWNRMPASRRRHWRRSFCWVCRVSVGEVFGEVVVIITWLVGERGADSVSKSS